MKLKKIFLSLIAMVGILFGSVALAQTTAPDSFIVDSKDLQHIIQASKYLGGGDLGVRVKINTDGQYIYCTESHDLSVSSGTQKYTLSKELDARFAYVLANGYPNKHITGDDDEDYLITAFSIWYLINPEDPYLEPLDIDNGTYRGNPNSFVVEVGKLVKAASNYTYTTPTIKLNASSTGFTLSSDKKYYVSSSLSVASTGIVENYKVSLENAPSGTIVTDKDGNSKSEFAPNETFIVKVPVASVKSLNSEFKVNVSSNGIIYKAYLYTPEDAKYQNTCALYKDIIPLNSSLSLKLSIKTRVEISKIDATTGKELPGAKLTVKNSAGKVVDSWVSTNSVHVIEGLEPGKYTLTEEYAPEGYVLSKETVVFEVKLNGNVTKVVMKNSPEEKKSTYISKRDVTTGEELEGAHLELYDANNELVEAWVSGKEPHEIVGLKPGKYFLKEILAPEGYELSEEVVEFTVNKDGSVDGTVIMYNKPETIIEVPSTSSFKTMTASLIGIIIIGLGSMIIYKNYKKNETEI